MLRSASALSVAPRDGAPCVCLREPADDPDDLALDLDLGSVDRLHLAVCWLETDPILLAEEALERHPVVLKQGDDDVPVPCGCLGLNDDVVAIVDQCVDHA